MTLASGTKLGTYEVTSHIGSGGMGEVYQAHDSKLGRDVAIKVLPEQFARDPERLARFQREAKMLAALNHPNIAAIYGLEQSGNTHYLVMELVPGDTLRERVAGGRPVPVEEALTIARQIAEALEAAHGGEKGIIHRDLKPANVKVTPEGRVKVLDFGLAKAFINDASSEDVGNSPTLSMAATMHGVILGTAAYMSPEQARGKAVTKATDIWAFGAVVYELLTGKQAFPGEDVTDILAAVVRAEPDWTALPPDTPQSIRTLLRRCLKKDRRQRLQDATGVRIEIEDVLAGTVAADAAPVTSRSTSRERYAWAVAVALLFATTVALAVGSFYHAPQPTQPMSLTAEIGADASLYTAYGPAAILSPDGSRLAFIASGSDKKQHLYARSFDQLQATDLPGTEDARDPFFSMDGQWIGFFAGGKLKKISIQGGAPVTLCDAPNDRGGNWSEDGTIVFAPNSGGPLLKVPSAGGTPKALTTLAAQGEATQRWPQVLPGGEAVLFTSSRNTARFEEVDVEIAAYSVSTGQRKSLLRGGSFGRYLPTGFLTYVQGGTLFAVHFDPKRLEVTSQPVPILEGVNASVSSGAAQYAFSDTGAFVYLPGGIGQENVSIVWMDSQGKFTPLRQAPGRYYEPVFSPDGKRLAFTIQDDSRSDIWIYELERDTLSRLTFAGEANSRPVWTPDGKRITYSSQDKTGAINVWWIRADGAGDPQRLTQSTGIQYPIAWHPNGRLLSISQRAAVGGTGNLGIGTLSIEGSEESGWKPGAPKPFRNDSVSFIEGYPTFSPDGRWLAYRSNESGAFEVYVKPFPGAGGRWQISSGGGIMPHWSRDGKELYYRTTTDSQIMVVDYSANGDSFQAGRPRLWSPGRFTDRSGDRVNFDLHPDGKRIVVLKALGDEQAATNKVNIVLNWFEEVKSRVPTGTK